MPGGTPAAGLDLEPDRGHASRRQWRRKRAHSIPRGVLDFIAAHAEPAIFHLKDFHEPLRESPEIRRRLRDIYESMPGPRKFVVITSPVRVIPEELERSLLYLELRPPDLVGTDGVSAGRERLAPPRRGAPPTGAAPC